MSRKREIINFLLDQLEKVSPGNQDYFRDQTHLDEADRYVMQSDFRKKVRRGSGFAPKTVDDIEVHLSVPGENRLYGPVSHGIINASIILMSHDNDSRNTIDNAIEDIKFVIDSDALLTEQHKYGITTLKITDILFTPIGKVSIRVTEIKLELVYELTR